MAEITCCSSATCNSLLTVGYMERLISGNPCFYTLERGGTAFHGCCDAPSSSTVVTYSQANNEYYAKKRVLDDNDPNNDEAGFTFTVPSRNYDGCCGQFEVGNTILKESEASFGYTMVDSHVLTAHTKPDICNPYYYATATKRYIRYNIECNGDRAIPIETTVEYEGEIQKNFQQNSNHTNAWTVSFTPSSETITSLAFDCVRQINSSITWNFPEYVVGYDFESSQLESEIPCEGTDITLTFSSNTTCTSDFNISVSAVSINNQGIVVNDDTINISTNCSTSQPIGETGRQAIISACTTNIHIGTNTNGYENGAIYIAYSANSGEITGETEYTFKRSLCAWYAGSVESPSCDEYWPKVNWTNPPSGTGPKDVQQIEKNCNNSKLN